MTETLPTAAALRMRRYRIRRRGMGFVERRDRVDAASAEVWSDHRLLDIRSLAAHAIIARDLVDDPRLLERARANLDRWNERHDDAPSWIGEWRSILERSPEDVACFLVSSAPDAVRLRQSSPFAGMLPPEKRRTLLQLFKATPR